jgi:hypothetical protein
MVVHISWENPYVNFLSHSVLGPAKDEYAP